MKRLKCLVIFLLVFLLSACKGEAPASGNFESETIPSFGMQVHYIDIGQGDCTLIESDGHYMLIDSGDNSKGTAVQLYLQKQGVKKLDYLVLTHPDSDHIGGADVIITKFDIETIIMPDIKNETRTYDDVIEAMKYRNYKNALPIVGDEYQLGNASFTIVAPNHYEYGNNTNDFSVGLLLQHGKNRFLFTGDGEEAAEKDILDNGIDISADVYKAAHHGSSTSAYEPFLETVNPGYCVISCGQGNSYGHPHAETLAWMEKQGIDVYRTDRQGTIVCTSDGENITFQAVGSKSYKQSETAAPISPGENSTRQNTDAGESTYILNTSSKKFHRPDCSGVETMKDKNKQLSDKAREEIIAEGYEACKTCRP